MVVEISPETEDTRSLDAMLIKFIESHPCLWDKTNHSFRNQRLKESKWKDCAGRLQISSHAAIRRYKTLCERFRREMVKQQSIPHFISDWNLFKKFASLKDKNFKIMDERKMNNSITINNSTLYECGAITNAKIDIIDDKNDTIHSDSFKNLFDNRTIVGRANGLCVGGCTEINLSTDTIAAFCQFLEANLKQLTIDQSDELIGDISSLLSRKIQTI